MFVWAHLMEINMLFIFLSFSRKIIVMIMSEFSDETQDTLSGRRTFTIWTETNKLLKQHQSNIYHERPS